MNAQESLAHALRRLPPDEPPADLFSSIVKSLERKRARRRRLIPLGLAAGVALALLLLRGEGSAPAMDPVTSPSDTATATLAAPAASSELQRLSEYSRRLESWLATTPEGAPRDGRNLMAAAELEDLVGLVDMQLSAARDAGESLPLWRQRVALLEDLAAVRSEPAVLGVAAAQGSDPNPIL
jgi:hypothetical protein